MPVWGKYYTPIVVFNQSRVSGLPISWSLVLIVAENFTQIYCEYFFFLFNFLGAHYFSLFVAGCYILFYLLNI